MGQVRTLVWKNFQFVKRHPFITAFFYLLPTMFSIILRSLVPNARTYLPACDHDHVALFPSPPDRVIGSLLCSAAQLGEQCVDSTYQSPYEISKWFDSNGSLICQGNPVSISMATFCSPSASDTSERTRVIRHLLTGSIVYFPPSDNAASILATMSLTIDVIGNLISEMHSGNNSCFSALANRTFPANDKAAAITQAKNIADANQDSLWGMIEFKTLNATNTIVSITSQSDRRSYLSELFLQSLLDAALYRQLTGTVMPASIEQKLLPEQCHVDPAPYDAAFNMLENTVVFGVFILIIYITADMGAEKNNGLLEILFINGVPRYKVKLSWGIFGGCMLMSVIVPLSVFLKFGAGALMDSVSFLLLLLLLLLFGAALLCLSLMVSSLMPTPEWANAFMSLSTILALYVPTWAQLLPDVGYTETGWLVLLACIIHPAVAVLIGLGYIVAGTKYGQDIDLFAMHSPIANDQFGGFTETIIILIGQCVVYLIFSWYFDHTVPSKYGMKRSVLFPFQPSYWLGNTEREQDMLVEIKSSADVEPLTEEKSVGISIVNLTKKFGKDKVAVSHLTIDFYEHDVSAFLGHNGSGKSSTINMLTGMLTPSSGTAQIDHKDIWSNMTGARESLGFCPQYDIIYPALTPEEHVRFYGELKGIGKDEIEEYSSRVFKLLGMDAPDQLKTIGKQLSGGMKRKLSVALAFLGAPKVVILDEPTSAIDPFSRRAIWDLILEHKTKSTILLSTHNMDEADILGDRIAVINGGVLRCFGTPMYLKSRYGDGFSLIVAHGLKFDAAGLEDKLKTILPLSVTSSSHTETAYSIPLASARSPAMIDMFVLLETESKSWDITSFGISESTMEQVFLKVAADECADEAEDLHEMQHGCSADVHFQAADTTNLWIMQLKATLIKRIHIVRRNRLWLLFQLLMPVLLTCILFVTILATNPGNSASSISDILNNNNQILLNVWRSRYDYNAFFYQGPTNDPFLTSILRAGLGDRPQHPQEAKCQSKSQVAPIPVNNISYCNCDGCIPAVNIPFTNFASNDRLLFVNDWNITQFILNNEPDNLIGGFFVTNDTKTHVLWSDVVQRNAKKKTKEEAALFDMKAIMLNAHTNLLLRTQNDQPVCQDLAPQVTLYLEEATFSSNGLGSVQQIVTGILFASFSAIALVTQTNSMLKILTTERTAGCKQLQYSMGLSRVIYWMGNLIWDGLIVALSIFLMSILMLILRNLIVINVVYFFVVSLIYGVGMLLQAYILTFIFEEGRYAYPANQISSQLLVAIAITLEIISLTSKVATFSTISTILCVFPSYFLTSCLVQGYFRQVQGLSPWPVLPTRLIACIIFDLLAFGLIILLEKGTLTKLCCSKQSQLVTPVGEETEQDADVVDEETAVMNGGDRYILAVKQLSKTFTNFNKPSKQAVKSVSFGVEKGVCFGLAGLNGAGKTSLFQMLTGALEPTAGDACFKETSIFSDRVSVAKHIAYCPQENTLFDDMTAKEHLKLYASIRGIPAEQQTAILDNLIAEVGLTQHQKKIAKDLSGGNKRKLNLALALLASPELLFLDEMSTGMDPKARRAAWMCVESALARGCSAVLTSHSMEECEALCSRMTIMVNGQLKCVGGIQYLKDKFGNNYNLKLRLAPGDGNLSRVQCHILDAYPNAKTVEQRPGFLEMKIASEGLKLSKLFALIHNEKQMHSLVDFSVTQTTLDHVFVSMARDQS